MTINGVAVSTQMSDATGDFTANFATASLGVSGSPYVISYGYLGDGDLAGVTNTSTTLSLTPVTPALSGLSAGTMSYGQTLGSDGLSGTASNPNNGSLSVAGAFAFSSPGSVPTVGAASQSVTFAPADATDYTAASGTALVTVHPATPTLSGISATRLSSGQALSASTISGTASNPNNGSLSVAGTFAFTSPATAPGIGTSIQSVTFTPTDATDYTTASGTVSITVSETAGPATDAWTGAASPNWDAASANWIITPPGTSGDYADGDTVTFGDAGVSVFAINVNANVSPAGMIFNNSANNYTLSSAGGYSVNGSGGLTLAGIGGVTLNNNNNFTGPIVVGSSATLTLGGASQLDGGDYAGGITNNGSLDYDSSATQTFSGAVAGTGQWFVNGPGQLTFTASNTFTGNVVINGGIVSVASPDNNASPASSGLGDPQVAGRTITINNGGMLSVDAGNAFGSGTTLEPFSFVVNQGGVLRATAANSTMGPIFLNGARCLPTPATR